MNDDARRVEEQDIVEVPAEIPNPPQLHANPKESPISPSSFPDPWMTNFNTGLHISCRKIGVPSRQIVVNNFDNNQSHSFEAKVALKSCCCNCVTVISFTGRLMSSSNNSAIKMSFYLRKGARELPKFKKWSTTWFGFIDLQMRSTRCSGRRT